MVNYPADNGGLLCNLLLHFVCVSYNFCFIKFVIVPTLIYASETLMWIEGKKSNIQGVDMSCLRDACGVKN